MNKLNMNSKDVVSENVERIAELFPSVVKETNAGLQIDFDLLKQEMSNDILDNTKEKYQLTWPGKKESILESNTPTNKTLRPLKEKSVDFENTENIYIEGDNLEVLKTLQESYLNKIKCIYIDPPYNTGNDFIYNDKFNKKAEIELEESGQLDDTGSKLVTNKESSGRFHSDWLSMMYSRIKLSRNLLAADGAIFISIDDNEIHNLRKVCDEIFGENNFVAEIPRLTSAQRPSQEKYISKSHDYILVYAKQKTYNFNNVIKRDLQNVKKDKIGQYIEGDTSPILASITQGYSKGGDYDIEYNGKIFKPIDANGDRRRWLWTKDRMDAAIKLGILRETQNSIRVQNYIDQEFEIGTNIMREKNVNLILSTFDLMNSKYVNNKGTSTLKSIGLSEYFDFPKPKDLIKQIISLLDKDSIVLDFFSGSATTAHAVMELNAEDNGSRKYIMVQLDETTDEKSEAYKEGYKYITDIGQERIKRAAKKIKEETNADIDYGFRVYKLDSSNMKDVYYKPNEYKQDQLELFEDNIKEDRTSLDILTQVMLDLGLSLDLKIEEKSILENKVYFVENNSLVACFDDNINNSLVDELLKNKPLKLVFKENSFKRDSDKINLKERVKNLSPETEISIL